MFCRQAGNTPYVGSVYNRHGHLPFLRTETEMGGEQFALCLSVFCNGILVQAKEFHQANNG